MASCKGPIGNNGCAVFLLGSGRWEWAECVGLAWAKEKTFNVLLLVAVQLCLRPTMGGGGLAVCTQGISNNVIVVFSFHYEMTTKAKFISLRKREWQLSCLIVFFYFVTFHSELVSDFLNNVSSLRFHTPVPPALPASMLMLFDCLLW